MGMQQGRTMGNVTYKLGTHARYDAMLGAVCIGWARYNEHGNYVSMLWVHEDHRRKGVASSLVRFIATERGVKLNRAPGNMKSDAVKKLSTKMGDELIGAV